MFQDITVKEMMVLKEKGELVIIDVRSPSEFQNSTIPGSINIPIFDDQERSEIGTLYKQVSKQAAQDRSLEIVSAKLPAFIKTFQQLETRNKIVFCWRGGMRSKTTATVLSLMNVKVFRLLGGIRAYRHWVLDTLEGFEWTAKPIVLHGYTGTGKTNILQKLEERGKAILNLEQMAGHRGSIFGHIGLPAHNQKTFDALLVEQLLSIQHEPHFFMEAESKRIGKVLLPEFLIQAKMQGVPLLIEMPLATRVKHIMEDYRPWLQKEACIQAFRQIKQRIHTPVAAEIEEHLLEGRFEEAIELLLLNYYDPRYTHSTKQYDLEPKRIRVNSVDEAVDEIMDTVVR